MELQALRYAAMVSTMTFEQLAETYQRYLGHVAPAQVDTSRAHLAEFLEDAGGEDTVLERRVRIILVSGGFDPQITTTVLWLNDMYGLDITCIRMVPYRVDHRLLLDVQQVIPLPEAEALMVRLRQRETAARASASTGGADWTQYVIVTSNGESQPLRKRRAVLALVHALHGAGVRCADMQEVIPGSRFLGVDEELDGEDLAEAFVTSYPKAHERERRWFLDQPVHEDGRTWVLSKMWGTNTVTTLDALIALAPNGGFGYRPIS